MKLSELYRAVQAALDGELDTLLLGQLARRAAEIADLTTWAPGIIDPHGQAVRISLALEARIKTLYLERLNLPWAELHDALGELRSAILRHDEDLRPPCEEDEHDEY